VIAGLFVCLVSVGGLPPVAALMKKNNGHYFQNFGQNSKNNGQNFFQRLRYSFAMSMFLRNEFP